MLDFKKTVGLGLSLVIATSSIAFSESQGVISVVAVSEPPERAEWKSQYHRNLEIEYPEDNAPRMARIELGRNLFFDPRLSRSGGQSCASCHNPSFDWGDGLGVGVGDNLKQLGRRSPTILNLAWAEPLMWDGRADSLEEQALGPLKADVEMNMPIDKLIERLSSIPGYLPMFAEAYDGTPEITGERVALAIAAFERTIISERAPFDKWIEGDETAISASAKRGFDLFNGDAKCASCHEGWRFTDDSFYDIGLKSTDLGRGALFPGIASMQYAFKTPGLRNISGRAPYMHSGQLSTLRDVVKHYSLGGINRPSRSEDVSGLDLSEGEVGDIVAFLETLTSKDKPVMLPVLPR